MDFLADKISGVEARSEGARGGVHNGLALPRYQIINPHASPMLARRLVLALVAARCAPCSGGVAKCLAHGAADGGALDAATCAAERVAFGLCGGDEPRGCLFSRVPWRTPYARVQCCLGCCLNQWQEQLGLTRLARAWASIDGVTVTDEFLSRVAWTANKLHGFAHARFS
mmetsp:Transcript_27531/g.98258  ORF Transcript_27531/g.98258 Transcript_27531/m.98258 type:complete len:170 (-) Transcript_27531:1580-2089(-)